MGMIGHNGSWRLLAARGGGLLLLAVLVGGCVSSSKARRKEREAFQLGQQQGAVARPAEQPSIWFRGLIRHPRIPWTEGITLAQAMVTAEFTGAIQPGSVRVIRQGQAYPIDLKLLLRGEVDPLLEAGDIVEVLR